MQLKTEICFCLMVLSLSPQCQKNMKFSYVDGSGNRYHLLDQQLTYAPMTPEHSSSGTYSGGDPAVKNLSKTELSQLKEKAEGLVADTTCHTQMRTMGTGTLRAGEKRVLLSYRCRSKQAFESWLKALLKED
ncbi:MAG: hypothetical protein AAFR61_23940 [Bacteroidota bacterium]